MTEKQLIQQIKGLKEIKPRQEWAVLLKSEIFAEKQEAVKIPAQKAANWKIEEFIENWKLIIENSFGRKLAYSFATLAFIFVGLVGFAQYTMPGDLLFPVRKITEQSEAALTGQTRIKQDVANLNNRINDLAKVAKEGKKDNIFPAISEVNEKAGILVKNLKESNVEDADTIKEIAASLKVLADVAGADVTDIPEINSLYQTLAERQIADLEKSTLTEEQENGLVEIKGLYKEEKYVEALEKILLINIIIDEQLSE